MTDNHPITPPRKLQDQWFDEAQELDNISSHYVPSRYYIATQAARWGADQELDACCAEVEQMFCWGSSRDLRTIRRPKPPSLKEQALEALAESALDIQDNSLYRIIRQALEQLPND